MSVRRSVLGSYLPILLIFISLVLFSTRDFSQAYQSAIDVTNVHKVAAVVIVTLLLTGYLVMRGIPRGWSNIQKYYLGYIIIGIASSILYSQWILFSLWKILEVSAVFLLSLYVLSVGRRDQTFPISFYELVLSFYKFLVLVTLLGVVFFPEEAIRSPLSDESLETYGTPLVPYQIFGVIIHINPNSLGTISAILLFVYIQRLLAGDHRIGNKVWAVAAGTLLIFSHSRTAWIGFLLSLSLALIFSPCIRKRTKFVLVSGMLILVASFSGFFIDYMTRGYDQQRLMQLSGRMVWWATAIDEYVNADLLGQTIGLGYMDANRFILADKLDSGGAATLHSDYIDALISTGFIGALMLIMAVSSLAWSTFKYFKRSHNILSVEFLGITVILIIRSLTGTTVASHNLFLILFFSIGICVTALSKHLGQRPLPTNGQVVATQKKFAP